MKETPVSNAERAFLLKALAEGKRVDGRNLKERRDLRLTFGSKYGCCVCSCSCSGNGTGNGTSVLAQVSCQVVEPAATRPNEGLLKVKVQFLCTAAPRFCLSSEEESSSSAEVTETTRLLERLLVESRCLDTESLCIVAEEKVWCVRVDVRILNHAGNVADCASVAAVAAMAHFRRPDVTLDGSVVTIHPTSERDPIPLAMHHFPIASTYAFFKPPPPPSEDEGASAAFAAASGHVKVDEDKVVATDPSHLEEAVMDGKVVLGVNPYGEICTLHLAGRTKIRQEFVLKLVRDAAEHAKVTVNRLKNSLAEDEALRKKGPGGAAAGDAAAGDAAAGLGLASMALDRDIMLQHMEAQRMVELERIMASLNNDDASPSSTSAKHDSPPVISVRRAFHQDPEKTSTDNNEGGGNAVVEMQLVSSSEDEDDHNDLKKVVKTSKETMSVEDSDSEEEVTAVVSGSTMAA